MRTPLLARDDDVNGGAPSLSGGPAISEESEFSQLIAQQSPFDDLAGRFDEGGIIGGGGGGNSYGILDVDPNDLIYGRAPNNTRLLVVPPRGPLTTAIAGTLSLLHLICIWSSYTADTWAESRIRISIEWQTEYLPMLNDAKEQVLRSTNLMTLLQDLGASRNYVLMFVLWTVSLLLPCVFMIVSPTFVLGDYMHPILYTNRSRSWNGRGTLETSMRWAFMTFYVIVLLSLATSFMELQWTDTTVQAGNRARGPLAAYVFGIASAVTLAVVLRYPSSKKSIVTAEPSVPATSGNGISLVRPPPPQAFQHPWIQEEEHDDEPTMMVLEETSDLPPPDRRNQLPASLPSTPELLSENGEQEDNKGLPFWYKFAAFQLGLLSLFLWIPAFYLPVLKISYGGLATNFLTESNLRIYVWDIYGTLWQQGVRFETPVWILLIVVSVLVLTTLALPLGATFLAVLAWVGNGPLATKCYSWLFVLHPTLGGFIFSVSLLCMVHALTPFSTSLLDHESSGLCEKFHAMSGETCLDVTAKILPGLWFYLLQSLILEVFVLVTLRWG